jgi:hypothetical protein
LKVEIGSLFAMTHGGERAVQIIWELLAAMGFLRGGNDLSRVDACADLFGMSSVDLIRLIETGHAIKRAKGDHQTFGHTGPDGISVNHSYAVGKAARIRIYDKPRELRKNNADEKADILRAKRWGVAPDTPLKDIIATRVEFQLRRLALKRMCGVKSVEDYFLRRSAIIKWLLHEWFRVVAVKPDRVNGHQGRSLELHPVWLRVERAFAEWVGRSSEPMTKPQPRPPKLRNLLASGMGFLTSICARAGVAVNSLEEAVEQVFQLGLQEFARIGRTPMEEIERKRILHIASTGAIILDPGDIPF